MNLCIFLFVFQANTNQVIEIPIRKCLDIQENWRADNPQLRISDDMYFLLTECEGFQRMVIFFRFGREPLGAASWTKRIGKLIDRENAPAVQARFFFVS